MIARRRCLRHPAPALAALAGFLALLPLTLLSQPKTASTGAAFSCTGIAEPVFDVILSLPAPGIVAEQKFKEGDFVQAGDVIMQLDSRLETLEVERYRLVMENKKADWESTKAVFDKTGSVSRDDLLKKESDYRVAVVEHQIAVEELNRRSLHSPAAGVITELKLHVGESCAAYQPVARVVDTRRCYFVTEVEARDATRVAGGQEVRLEFVEGGAPAKAVGKIVFISPVVDAASNLRKIKVLFDNEEGRIQPGLTGSMFPVPQSSNP